MGTSELKHESTRFEPDSELKIYAEDESEQGPEDGPRLTGVKLHLSTGGVSQHDRLRLVL